MTSDTINICYCVTGKAHKLCTVKSIESILSFYKQHRSIRFYVFGEVIPGTINLEPTNMMCEYTTHWWRFLAPRVLYEKFGLDRVLYLDNDTIAMTDISMLYNTMMSTYPIAAVPMTPTNGVDDTNYYYKSLDHGLGLAGADHLKTNDESLLWFNAGVLLFNIMRFVDNEYDRDIIKLSQSNQSTLMGSYEELCANVVLAGKWLELDKRWNHNTVAGYRFDGILHPWVQISCQNMAKHLL